MLAVFKNNCNRLWEEKMYLVGLIDFNDCGDSCRDSADHFKSKQKVTLPWWHQISRVLTERGLSFMANSYFNVTVLGSGAGNFSFSAKSL